MADAEDATAGERIVSRQESTAFNKIILHVNIIACPFDKIIRSVDKIV